jgi:hypothetical protein
MFMSILGWDLDALSEQKKDIEVMKCDGWKEWWSIRVKLMAFR